MVDIDQCSRCLFEERHDWLQVQKLKVDTESAMLEIDQILKANELSIALVAAIPSFLIGGISLVSLWRWLSPKPVDPRWEALPCR